MPLSFDDVSAEQLIQDATTLAGVHEGQDRALKDDFNVWLGEDVPSGLAQQVINAYVTNLPSFR